MKKFIFPLLVLSAFILSAAKPVGIWSGNGHHKLSELFNATVMNPQWKADKPVKAVCKGDFDKFAAVVYTHGGEHPLRFREWKANNYPALEKYVRNGGTFIILANGSRYSDDGKTGKTGVWETLLGAKTWVNFSGKAEIKAADWQDCGSDPKVFTGMLKGNFAALKDLTTAKVIIGNNSGALVTVNQLGKGKVYYINVRLTESNTGFPQNPAWRNVQLEQYFPFAKKIHSILMAQRPAVDKTPREVWETTPLGPAPVKDNFSKPVRKKLVSNRKYTKLDGAPLKLIENGKPRAVFVPGGLGKGAAKMLNELLKKISGVQLPLAAAGAVSAQGDKWRFLRVHYDTKIVFAKSEKVEITAENNLITIAAPTPEMGIQTFMREALGYRMLWPGKDGEVYTESATVTIPPFKLTDAPFFAQRQLRNTLYKTSKTWKTPEGKIVKLSVPEEMLTKHHLTGIDPVEGAALRPRAGREWYPVQRLGGSLKSSGGMNFYTWKDRFSKTHPEYFALQFDGTRRQRTPHVRICKANPEVIKQAAADAVALIKKHKRKYYICAPTDGNYDIFCMCPSCRAWDPTGGHIGNARVYLGRNRPYFKAGRKTDRVLRFTSEVAKIVKKSCPNVTFRYLAYASYLAPPEYFRDFPEKFMTTFVGLEYLNNDNLARDRKYWDFWASVSSEMILRPNCLLAGGGFPLVYAHELGRDIRYCAETGMVGADFDSIPHHWATMGLNYYVLAQMLWDPTQSVDDIIADYCRSFGKGAEPMKKYFLHCEKLTSILAKNQAENVKVLEDLTQGASKKFIDHFMDVFTENELKTLAGHLAKARQAAAGDELATQKVDFVAAGFDFTLKRLEFYRNYKSGKRSKALAEANKKFYQEFFRRYPYAVNVPYISLSSYYSYWRHCK